MLAELLLALAPVKLFVAGIIFLMVAWYATKAVLVMVVGGFTAGEVGVNAVRSQFSASQLHVFTSPEAFAANPIVDKTAALAGISVGGDYLLYALTANALLAVAMFVAVKALKTWIRATVVEREERYEREELDRRKNPYGTPPNGVDRRRI